MVPYVNYISNNLNHGPGCTFVSGRTISRSLVGFRWNPVDAESYDFGEVGSEEGELTHIVVDKRWAEATNILELVVIDLSVKQAALYLMGVFLIGSKASSPILGLGRFGE